MPFFLHAGAALFRKLPSSNLPDSEAAIYLGLRIYSIYGKKVVFEKYIRVESFFAFGYGVYQLCR